MKALEGFSPVTWAVVGAMLIITFFAGLGISIGGAYLVEQAAAKAQAASVVELCRLGNESRAQQITLWDHILHIAQPPPNETPAEKARRELVDARFRQYIHHDFAPRNCQHFENSGNTIKLP